MKLQNKVVLLTGAGSGIGRCLANELAAHGAQLILTDMNQEALDETIRLYGIESQILGTVISNFLDDNGVEKLVEEALLLSPTIDVLYNNAGMMAMGQVRNMQWSDYERMQKVNQNAPIKLTYLLLPQLIDNGGGYIAFTCSASALTTPPGAAFYGMTKAAVNAFAEGLRAEVHNKNISVTSICPGFVHTPLAQNIDYRDKKSEEQTKAVPAFIGSSPERVARLSVNAMLGKKAIVVIGWDEKVKRFIKNSCSYLYGKINLIMAKFLLDD
ncbi:MAG: SDR family oxidoreductase [Pseudomonadales bacterium]|nr:SDR family oxidoreductase [Pseudomonadales bacterium]